MLCIHRHPKYGNKCSLIFAPNELTPESVKALVECMDIVEVYDVSDFSVEKLYPVEEETP